MESIQPSRAIDPRKQVPRRRPWIQPAVIIAMDAAEVALEYQRQPAQMLNMCPDVADTHHWMQNSVGAGPG